MPTTPGALWRSRLGLSPSINSGGSTFAMAALNSGICFRHMAQSILDVKSFWVNFSSVSVVGTITARYETIDTATGKPTGTLYDAAATIAFAPVAGWQNVAFAVTPTTGRTLGNEYGLVLLTTLLGTTMTIRSSANGARLPAAVLTAADGSTRSNFAEVNNLWPAATLVLSDDTEVVENMCAYATAASSFTIYGTRAAGIKFMLNSPVYAVGLDIDNVTIAGTIADLRCRIFNSSDVLVAGCTCTLPKKSLGNANTRHIEGLFPVPVLLPAGTYRAIWDQTDHTTTSGNNFSFTQVASARVSGLTAGSAFSTTTTNIDAGTITWVDTATDMPNGGVTINSLDNSSIIINKNINVYPRGRRRRRGYAKAV